MKFLLPLVLVALALHSGALAFQKCDCVDPRVSLDEQWVTCTSYDGDPNLGAIRDGTSRIGVHYSGDLDPSERGPGSAFQSAGPHDVASVVEYPLVAYVAKTYDNLNRLENGAVAADTIVLVGFDLTGAPLINVSTHYEVTGRPDLAIASDVNRCEWVLVWSAREAQWGASNIWMATGGCRANVLTLETVTTLTNSDNVGRGAWNPSVAYNFDRMNSEDYSSAFFVAWEVDASYDHRATRAIVGHYVELDSDGELYAEGPYQQYQGLFVPPSADPRRQSFGSRPQVISLPRIGYLISFVLEAPDVPGMNLMGFFLIDHRGSLLDVYVPEADEALSHSDLLHGVSTSDVYQVKAALTSYDAGTPSTNICEELLMSHDDYRAGIVVAWSEGWTYHNRPTEVMIWTTRLEARMTNGIIPTFADRDHYYNSNFGNPQLGPYGGSFEKRLVYQTTGKDEFGLLRPALVAYDNKVDADIAFEVAPCAVLIHNVDENDAETIPIGASWCPDVWPLTRRSIPTTSQMYSHWVGYISYGDSLEPVDCSGDFGLDRNQKWPVDLRVNHWWDVSGNDEDDLSCLEGLDPEEIEIWYTIVDVHRSEVLLSDSETFTATLDEELVVSLDDVFVGTTRSAVQVVWGAYADPTNVDQLEVFGTCKLSRKTE